MNSCLDCVHNINFECTIVRDLIVKHLDVIPTPEHTQIFSKPTRCKQWSDRLSLRCEGCLCAVRNDNGRPIMCVIPLPKWLQSVTRSATLQRPITIELANNCNHFSGVLK